MRKEWTEYEEMYMQRRFLYQPVKTTAMKLNRTEASIKHKARDMGLSHYNDAFNAKSIAKCFNSDVSVVIRWIKKFNLPCKKVDCGSQTRYVIDEKDFWKWAENNKGIINWGKYTRLSICPEPEWLQDEIKNYKTKRHRERYTEHEIILIKNLLHRGLSYKEIANQMERSYEGIKHMCASIYY